MFFIAASNSADGVSWFDAVDFFCVFAKPTDALAKRKTAGSSHGALKEGLFFIKNDSNSSPLVPAVWREHAPTLGILKVHCQSLVLLSSPTVSQRQQAASYFGVNAPLPSSI